MEEKKKKANTTTTTLLPHNGAGGQSQIINITTCIIYEMKIFLCKHVETCLKKTSKFVNIEATGSVTIACSGAVKRVFVKTRMCNCYLIGPAASSSFIWSRTPGDEFHRYLAAANETKHIGPLNV